MATYVMSDVRDDEGGAIVVSGTNSTVVFGPKNYMKRPTKSFFVRNIGTVSLSGVMVQTNPDRYGTEDTLPVRPQDTDSTVGPSNDSLWMDYASMGNFESGQQKMLVANDHGRWWRITATHTGPTTEVMVSGWALASTI